jgi:hypothetical protein
MRVSLSPSSHLRRGDGQNTQVFEVADLDLADSFNRFESVVYSCVIEL